MLNTTPRARMLLQRANGSGRAAVQTLTYVLREKVPYEHTLLAVCPNSEAVVRAALKAADAADAPLLFAATLNQVDRDGGYTGWTPASFTAFAAAATRELGVDTLVLPCLDHGGPWMKDAHVRQRFDFAATMDAVRASLEACLDAGYALLHIDATVGGADRQPASAEEVLEHTLLLIEHAERYRTAQGLPPVAYEVGAEEVYGEPLGEEASRLLLKGLDDGLDRRGLPHAWPCFVVGNIGTALHTTSFNPLMAHRLVEMVRPYGTLVKGHYTDHLATPSDYPVIGIGGANVGPGLTEVEVDALLHLEAEAERGGEAVGMEAALRAAVVQSERWRKWLAPDEQGRAFDELASDRQAWLVRTGSRYVWTTPAVREARAALYALFDGRDAADYVEACIGQAIARYLEAFNLVGFNEVLEEELPDAV